MKCLPKCAQHTFFVSPLSKQDFCCRNAGAQRAAQRPHLAGCIAPSDPSPLEMPRSSHDLLWNIAYAIFMPVTGHMTCFVNM
jgi:hypothetical protein